MDLAGLKWTKNVKPNDKDWAYDNIDSDLRIFRLHWRDSYKENAYKPKEGELIILRQYAKVTHIVKLLNNTLYSEGSKPDFNICRLVQVVWMTKDWDNPPANKKVFDCPIHFPPDGKVIELENIQDFKQQWDNQGGLSAFQKRVQEVFKSEHEWQPILIELDENK
ncbi:MAG: hypothetical protein KME05_10535 [Gloeocapsa sp. UFS-A4-WI-NPMV-4B04]|jgi:hypothetical protein|nr:hypothetical protein [Gloeocapsa sp. UFS-A4-WI-NPMV-4B04]